MGNGGMGGRINTKALLFTYIMMIAWNKTNLKGSKASSFTLPNIHWNDFKKALNTWQTDAKYNKGKKSIPTPNEVTGLGLFVQLPKIYSGTEYKNLNVQN